MPSNTRPPCGLTWLASWAKEVSATNMQRRMLRTVRTHRFEIFFLNFNTHFIFWKTEYFLKHEPFSKLWIIFKKTQIDFVNTIFFWKISNIFWKNEHFGIYEQFFKKETFFENLNNIWKHDIFFKHEHLLKLRFFLNIWDTFWFFIKCKLFEIPKYFLYLCLQIGKMGKCFEIVNKNLKPHFF